MLSITGKSSSSETIAGFKQVPEYKDLVVPGDKPKQSDAKVMDANTKEIVFRCYKMLWQKLRKEVFRKTDDSGAISYSWDTPATSGGNRNDVVSNVSSQDYPEGYRRLISFKMDKTTKIY